MKTTVINTTFLLLSLTLAFPKPCPGQYESLRFDRLTIEDGLSNPSVMDIIQDRQGFMWFGLLASIVRYDGYEMKTYFPSGEHRDSIPERDIPVLFQDKSGNIWVTFRYQKAKLFKYDIRVDSFIPYLFDPAKKDNPIKRSPSGLIEDKLGRLLISTWGDGLYVADIQKEKEGIPPSLLPFKHFVHIPDDPHSLSAPNNSMAGGMATDGNGNIWIPTDYGLAKFKPGEDRFDNFFIAADTVPYGNEFNWVLFHPPRTLWVGTAIHGLVKFDLKTETFGNRFFHDPDNPFSLSTNLVDKILKTANGKFWVGGNGNLDIFDPRNGTFTHIKDVSQKSWGENFKWNNALVSDYSNNIWMGVWQSGIYKYNPDKNRFHFLRPNQKEELGDRQIWAQCEDRNGFIWMTTGGNGFVGWDRDNNAFFRFRHQPGNPNSLSDDRVNSIVEGPEGYLWIGTEKGLDRFDPKTKTFRHFHPYPDLAPTVRKSKKGDIWVGNWDAKPCRLLDKEKGVFEYFFDNPIGTSTMEEDDSGKIWFGINQWGMFCLDPETGQFDHFLPEYGVHDIHFDRYGNFWIATHSGGLKLFDRTNKQVIHLDEKEHKKIGIARAILADDHGYLWMRSPTGIVKFDPQSRRVVRQFSTLHWMEKNDLWYENGNGFKTSRGEMFFNSPSGVLFFHPDSIQTDTFPPKIALTEFRLFDEIIKPGNKSPLNRDISQTKKIELAHWQNELTFSFAALHFKMPEENEYACKLENYDPDWRQLGTQRRAHYTNLSPGNYILRVKAANSDGLWGDDISLSITILSPWWATWWAYLLYALTIYGIFYFIRKFELRQKLAKAEARRLQELDAVKTQLYTNITHEFRTPLTIILGMAEQLKAQVSESAKSGLDMIRRNGGQLLNLVNQMLDLSKMETGGLQLDLVQSDIINYLQYLTESFHSFAKSKGIRLHLMTDLDQLIMDYDPARLQQVISNLLSNAIKFTPDEGDVYISVNRENSEMELKVQDTGVGIPEENLPYVFDRFYQAETSHTRQWEGTGIGLALAKELVNMMNGKITVKSRTGKGTEFTILLPIKQTAEKQTVKPFEVTSSPGEGTWIGAGDGVISESSPSIEMTPFSSLLHTPTHKKDVTSIPASTPLLLIIEDNHDVVKYLLSCLNHSSRIEVAYNGQQGIEKALDLVPDLIISDVMMPKKDGFEVCQTLKTDERTSHIPIILLTAKADIESKLAGLAKGADAYLPKPFHKEELLIRIKKLLELRRQLQAHYLAMAADMPPSRETVEDLPAAENIENAFIQKMRSIIEAHLDDHLFSVEQLCREAAMSKPQLYRKLKALTGKSANELIRSLRLTKAKALLLDRELTIAAVAYDTGFSDPDYFAKVFKKEVGVTPSEFRDKS